MESLHCTPDLLKQRGSAERVLVGGQLVNTGQAVNQADLFR